MARQDHPQFNLSQAEIEHTLRQITQLGQAGNLTEAIDQCQRLLQQHPDLAQAWHLLSLISLQQGQTSVALQQLNRAIELDPQAADFYSHAGVIHCSLGNLEAGIADYQQALALQPQAVAARYNLGLALQKLKRWEEALQVYLLLNHQQPNYAPSHFQIANLYQRQQKFAAAIAHYRQAILIQPQYPEACYNLGVALQTIGEIDQALTVYQQALAIKPHYVEAHNGLGALYEKRGQASLATTHYQQALSFKPDYIPALINLGNVKLRLEQLSEAEAAYRQVLHLAPSNIQALDSLIKILLKRCDWAELAVATAALKTLIQAQVNQNTPVTLSPLSALYLPFSVAEQQAIAQLHAGEIAKRMTDRRQELGMREWGLKEHLPVPNSRLRLGYVSGDFRNHPVAHLILRLFELHNRDSFEVFAYSLGPDDGSPKRQKLMADCDRFQDISRLTPSESAQQIYQDNIDILVDLAGYTDYACPELFALRPAPLQINYLGYPGTLGADYIDYVITDSVLTPPELAEFFTEQCLYLPHSYQLNNNQQLIPEQESAGLSLSTLKLENTLPEDAFIYCCFNKSQKLEPTIFAVWMRILQQVPNSVLWLLSDRPEVEANLKAAAVAQGVDPNRLIFAPRVSRAEHLIRHQCADLVLDTLYYNAHVTGSDALWAGVPLVTVPGQSFAARVGASLLTAAGLPELITSSLEEYERLAVHLASHPQQLQQWKNRLVSDRLQSPLFDTPQTVRHLEAGYRLIWERYQSGQMPQAVWVGQRQGEKASTQSAFLERPAPRPITHSAQSTITCTADEGFLSWLSQAGGSLVITTYQAGKVILIGWNGQQVTVLPRQFTKPMGVAVKGDRLALTTQQEVILFANAQPLAHSYLESQPGRYDALYLPRAAYFTGDLHIHDMAFGNDLWFVNTRFSCLASLSEDFSFVPRWQPPFISELAPEDRCHLNGLAMVAERPKYVTALGESDQVGGWRSTRSTGGILIDVETGEILRRGLSMPHSPCWHQDKLWLLNSGLGELWQIDPNTQQQEVVCALPGFGRGLCLVGNYALVGLSQIRERHIFGELPVQQRFDRLLCGVAVVDLGQGQPVGLLEFPSGCQELYDVKFLPGVLRPTLLNREQDAVREAFTAPEFAYWLRPSALVQEG